MNAKIVLSALAVAALVLGNGVMIRAQDAQDASSVSTQGDVGTQAIVFPSLTNTSVNAVEVWRLTCTTTPFLFPQSARARLADRGGADGRRLYLHLTRQTTGATAKTTAADVSPGVFSPFASVGFGGAGSVYFIQVSKDRTGATVLGIPIAEPYTLQADCIAGGIVRPHLLTLIQNR